MRSFALGVLGVLVSGESLAAPVRLRPRVDCHGEQAHCEAVGAAMAAGAKAERVVVVDSDAYDFELVAEVHEVSVFFALRDRAGLRLIAHTDVPDYRATHGTADALVMLGFATIALAPFAYDMRPPTTMADRTRAWTAMTRRVLRQGVRGNKRFFGATELRGKRWTLSIGTPEVRRRPVVEENEILAKDSDFELAAADSDEARKAAYSASLAMAELMPMLDDAAAVDLGDGKATLVVQLHGGGGFYPGLVVRGNPKLAGALPHGKLAPPRARALVLPGVTRVLVPVTLRRTRS